MLVKAGTIEAPIANLAIEDEVEVDDGAGGFLALADDQLALEDGQCDAEPHAGAQVQKHQGLSRTIFPMTHLHFLGLLPVTWRTYRGTDFSFI